MGCLVWWAINVGKGAARFEMLDPKVQRLGDAAVLTYNFVSYGGDEDALRWNCTEVFRRRGETGSSRRPKCSPGGGAPERKVPNRRRRELHSGILWTSSPRRADNPLLAPWTGPFGAPPFPRLQPNISAGFDAAIGVERAEIASINANPRPRRPSTTRFLRWSGRRALDRVCAAFFDLAAPTQRRTRDIERDIAPCLHANTARSISTMRCSPASTLARRTRRRALDAEAARRRSLSRRFRARGRRLDAGEEERLAEIGEARDAGSPIRTERARRRKSLRVGAGRPRDLVGLPGSFLAAAATGCGARRARQTHRYALALLDRPFLHFSARRDLREKACRAFVARGDNGGAHYNGALMARPCGCAPSGRPFRLFQLRRISASTTPWPRRPSGARSHEAGLGAARAQALREAASLQEMIAAEGGNFELEAMGLALLRGKAAQGAV